MNNPKWYLGLGGSNHDFSACLLQNGNVEIAIEEERLTRKKKGYGVNIKQPLASINYCLQSKKLDIEDVSFLCVNDLLNSELYNSIRVPLKIYGHHLSHAASAFYPSNFQEAAILVIDYMGSSFYENDVLVVETISYYYSNGKNIELINKIVGEDEKIFTNILPETEIDFAGKPKVRKPKNSIGRLYAMVTRKCECLTKMGDGKMHTEAGKLMGLSAYGDDRFYNLFRSNINLKENGIIDITCGNSNEGLESECDDIIKEASKKGSEFLNMTKASLAWAAQKVLEEVIIHSAKYLYEITKSKNICLAGGVALNAISNHLILEKTRFKNIFIQPAAHDSGTAIGAAYLAYWEENNSDSIGKYSKLFSPYLGKKYSKKEILDSLQEHNIPFKEGDESLHSKIALSISKGKIIGLYQGSSEFGPRALGNRTILADPRSNDTKKNLNEKIKFREPYRPYAPAVCQEFQDEYFEMKAHSPYMVLIGYLRKEWGNLLPAITHVDNTARVQSVSKDLNFNFYNIIKEFGELTGVYILLNTSMNIMGEPIVESPQDAIRFLNNTKLDYLIIENYVCAHNEADLNIF